MQHFRILQSSELEFDLNSNLLLIVMCRDDLPDNSLAVVSHSPRAVWSPREQL